MEWGNPPHRLTLTSPHLGPAPLTINLLLVVPAGKLVQLLIRSHVSICFMFMDI